MGLRVACRRLLGEDLFGCKLARGAVRLGGVSESCIHVLERDPVAEWYRDDLDAVLSQKGLARHKALFIYWRDQAAGTPFPSRADIDPSDIPLLLPDVFLADVLREPDAPVDFRYRLIGTGIVEIEGEWTGARLSRVLADRERFDLLWQQYDAAAAGVASFRREKVLWQEEKHLVYEVLLLPLSSDGKTVDMLLGMASRGW